MAVRIRIKTGEQTNNKGELNLLDTAGPFAQWMVSWEIPFRFSYPDTESIFEFEDDDFKYLCDMLDCDGPPDLEFDTSHYKFERWGPWH